MRSQPIRVRRRDRDESGIALIVTLFLMAALSALGASFMFLSRTETFATLNYQMMSQARYAGESGVAKTVNFLLNSYQTPGTGSDPVANYNMTKSPVEYNGHPVVLSAVPSVASNYPDGSVVTAFASAGQGTLVPGASPVGYAAYATLMSMQALSSGAVVQTWAITSVGTVSGARSATVEVTSTLETPVVGVTGNGYAAFATYSGCGAITLSGSASTDSYDSSGALSGGKPVLLKNSGNHLTGGNVGTNGNLTESGGAKINGKLYTPRQGVGSCNNGGDGTAGNALSQSGSADVTEGLVQLPSTWAPPTPSPPSPLPGTTANSMDRNHPCKDNGGRTMPNCTSGGDYSAVATFAGGGSVATATMMGNVTISSDYTMHLTAGYYTFNSLSVSGAAKIVIDSGPVIINIAGTGISSSGTALSLSGGGVANNSFRASNLQINYGGSAKVSLSGGTYTSAMVNAPNAPVTLSGGADFYGSVISWKLTNSGGTKLHYDTQLNSLYSSQEPGNPLLTSFSWKKY